MSHGSSRARFGCQRPPEVIGVLPGYLRFYGVLKLERSSNVHQNEVSINSFAIWSYLGGLQSIWRRGSKLPLWSPLQAAMASRESEKPWHSRLVTP